MLLRHLHRQALYRPLVSRTLFSQATRPRQSFMTTRRVLAASGATIAAYTLFSAGMPSVYADSIVGKASEDGPSQNTLGELIRQYAVYAMCSSPTLIDWAPTILETLTSIPIIKQITEAVVSQTFFLQFVGGPTTDECIPLLERLRKVNMGVLFAYSVEVDEEEASGHGDGNKPKEALHKRIVKEMMHSIDVAGNFEDNHAGAVAPNHRRAWVAVKLTALVPDHISLINLSKDLVDSARTRPHSPPIVFPGCPRTGDIQALQVAAPSSDSHMTPADLAALTDLYQDLRSIATHAQKRGVRVIIDAEYSWYQPAVDVLTLELMREFNRLPSSDEEANRLATPLIYNTFQAYLRRTPTYLVQSIKDAQAGNYALGVKLVRGAYHEQENEAHEELRSKGASLSISPDSFPPVWSSKADTDASYNTCARLLLNRIAQDITDSRSLSDKQWLPTFLTRQQRVKAPTIGVLFGSHNWDSIRDILRGLEASGLAKPVGKFPAFVKPDGQVFPEDDILDLPDDVAERITIGQLYGMTNSLSNYIVARTRSSTPVVLKYIPYGSLSEVMPYLARRAIENKAILGNGQAAIERKQAWREIRKRLGFPA